MTKISSKIEFSMEEYNYFKFRYFLEFFLFFLFLDFFLIFFELIWIFENFSKFKNQKRRVFCVR